MKIDPIRLETNPNPEDVRAIKHGLLAFNNLHAEPENYQDLVLTLRDENGKITGGLIGYTQWRWLFVENLWVSDRLRGQGYGRELLHRAEQEAARRGCLHAHLDTLSFQALDFYRKQGYELFGVLDDFPPGCTRYFLQKRQIVSSEPSSSA